MENAGRDREVVTNADHVLYSKWAADDGACGRRSTLSDASVRCVHPTVSLGEQGATKGHHAELALGGS